MQDIEDYLGEFSLYEEIHVNGKVFILVHAGLDNFNTARSLDDYELYEVIFKRTNYTKVYYPDKYLVTGHTPTQVIKGNSRPGLFIKRIIILLLIVDVFWRETCLFMFRNNGRILCLGGDIR